MTDPEPMPTPVPTPPPSGVILLGSKLVAALLLLSSLVGLGLALFGAPAVVVGMFAFELVTLVAVVFAVLAAFGRFADGWALAMACVAGTVFAASALGYIDGRPNFLTSPDAARVLKGLVVARVSLAGVVALLATLAVFSRNPRSWRHFLIGAGLGLPVLLALAIAWKIGRPWLLTPQTGPIEILRLGVLVLGSVVLAVMFSAAVHNVIRAYEVGLDDQRPNNDAAGA
ncbi:MAG: hypothetical protein R3B57_10950 [Phycisphaerales bacterium]